jgi:hypothetical protein
MSNIGNPEVNEKPRRLAGLKAVEPGTLTAGRFCTRNRA